MSEARMPQQHLPIVVRVLVEQGNHVLQQFTAEISGPGSGWRVRRVTMLATKPQVIDLHEADSLQEAFDVIQEKLGGP